MDIECESWQDKGLEQIDRPVIRFARKIHKDSLDVGKGCLVSSNVSDDAKRKLIETDRKISTGYKPYYSVLLVIAVAVSLAVMVTCIFVSSDFISGLQISMIIELVIWCPGIFYIFYRNRFKVAVQNGETCVYRFPVQDKWIYVYLTESGREKTYLLQFGDVYTEVQESYENLRCGDFIDVYITSYRKKKYFAMPVL